MHSRGARALIALVSSVVVMQAASGAALASDGPVGVTAADLLIAPPRESLGPSEDEITSLMKHDGISREQALEILDLQRRAGDLGGELMKQLGDAYAGVWFDRANVRWKIGVVSDDAAERIDSALVERELTDIADLVPVRSTTRQLEAARDEFMATHPEIASKDGAAVAIDDAANALRVLIRADLAPDVLSELSDVERRSASGNTRVIVDERDPGWFTRMRPAGCLSPSMSCDPPYRPGTAILHDSWNAYPGECTAGFLTLGDGSPGYLFVLTAGHCLRGYRGGSQWNGRQSSGQQCQIGWQHNWIDSTRDAGIIRFGSPYFQSWYLGTAVWGQANEYPLYGEWWPVQGAFHCHTGITSWTQCGSNQQANVSVWLPNGVDDYTLHNNMVYNTACTSAGDSGGPWLYANLAAGIATHGSVLNCPDPGSWYQNFAAAASVMNVHLIHY